MRDWIVQNRQWLFSGAGISIIGASLWLLKKLFRVEPKTPQPAPISNSVVQAPVISVAPVFNLPHVEASPQPVPQKPPAPPEPNLVFCQIQSPHLYRVMDEFCARVSQGMENSFPRFHGIVAEIMNASKPVAAVGPARNIKAELAIQLDDREEIFGPLAWTDTNCNTVSIEMGNTAHIILAAFLASRFANPPGEWTVPINRRPRTDVLPGANKIELRRLEKRGEVSVQLRILQPESGKTLRIFEGLCRWGNNDQEPEFMFGP